MASTWLLLVIFISRCDDLELWCLMFILDKEKDKKSGFMVYQGKMKTMVQVY
jgi:hypothetical protein